MHEPKQYQPKPVEPVEAMFLDGTPEETMAVLHWVEQNTQGWFDPLDTPPGSGVSIDPVSGRLMISTLDGIKLARKGEHWVVKVGEGQFTTVPHWEFVAQYEAVDGSEMPTPTTTPEPEPEGEPSE
jgi:hypothetical protein